MSLCPRCGRPPEDSKGRLLALSRLDNKTGVCESCGTDEAMIAANVVKEPSRPLTAGWKKMEGARASRLYFG
jgi:hypothetical protein